MEITEELLLNMGFKADKKDERVLEKWYSYDIGENIGTIYLQYNSKSNKYYFYALPEEVLDSNLKRQAEVFKTGKTIDTLSELVNIMVDIVRESSIIRGEMRKLKEIRSALEI